jgi:hypothetical protein
LKAVPVEFVEDAIDPTPSASAADSFDVIPPYEHSHAAESECTHDGFSMGPIRKSASARRAVPLQEGLRVKAAGRRLDL